MNAAILASGGPTRFAGDPRGKAKAMVRIGDHPILWHLLKYYEYYGFGEFVVAVGHGGHAIRTYFDQLGHRQPPRHDGACVTIFPSAEPAWTVKLVDTGEATMSGGQIKRLEPYLDQAPFMLTSCDRLADVDLDKLRTFHRAHGGLATLTAIHPPTRFGRVTLENDQITAFDAKGVDDAAWV
ncbi:MAG: glucose-1-phosphate cytidylyltransferase, partial [Pseudomonadota bacterium]